MPAYEKPRVLRGDHFYGFKPVLPGLSGKTDKPPAMRVRVGGYTKKFPKLIE